MTYGATDMHETLADAREARLQDEGAPQPKFCKDCKWISGGDLRLAKCLHKLAERVAQQTAEYLVTGETPEAENYFCSTMRDCPPCGPEGKLWEPKS